MPEIIASCFIESIGTNVLFVKDIYTTSYDVIVYIQDRFYSCMIPIDTKSVESVIHAFENGLVSVEDTSHHINNLFYSTVIDGQREYLHRCDLSRHNHIEAFATRKKWLFKKLEEQGNPILK